MEFVVGFLELVDGKLPGKHVESRLRTLRLLTIVVISIAPGLKAHIHGGFLGGVERGIIPAALQGQ